MALVAAIACGCDLEPWVRLGIVAAVLVILWRGVEQLRSPGGRLHWHGDGRWRHEPGAMTGNYVQPRSLRRLGSVLWLAWPAADGHRYASLDASGVEPKDWRAIKARMKFPGHFGHGAR
ncbi:MAG: hypothetical protein KGL25_12105 [Gammaproteobacteria bacterium]|nr:hypothetical protein [Gammaproteobacteria bacterium]MDE2252133.1 hypothetical protein [Gammaproteobacteria bacterium]